MRPWRLASLALVLALVLGAAIAPARAQAPAPWEPRFSNPKPAPDDLMLPLPCGGAMAFRPVAVPSGPTLLDDRAIQLGDAESELGFNDYQRGAFLAAPFRGPGGSRVFYLGKYDVTRDQYAAVMNPTCPTASPQGRTAQSAVSWFDAVAFTERLSAWLLAHAADKLPRRDDAIGFVRLPTEEEWEYAARGGAAVSETDYLAPTWPMPEGAERYALAGAGMGDGRPQQVGQLLPNPLGLYDMLGNVEQWVLEPYRLNRVGRLQGMAGGLVARGGSYATPLEELRTSMRTEIPPFDPAKKAPTTLAFIGFRVALSTVAGGGLKQVNDLRDAFNALQRTSASTGSDPRAAIERLKQLTPDQTLRRALDGLSAQIASDERARVDADRQTLRAELNAATALCYALWRIERNLQVQERQLTNPQFTGMDMTGLREGIARNQAELQTLLDGYGQMVRQIAAGGSVAEMPAQARLVADEMTARNDRRRAYLEIVVKHVNALAAGRALTPETMKTDILAVP